MARTRGTWFELSEVSSGALRLDALLADLLVAPVCDQEADSRVGLRAARRSRAKLIDWPDGLRSSA